MKVDRILPLVLAGATKFRNLTAQMNKQTTK
jgi:hypothetical protein